MITTQISLKRNEMERSNCIEKWKSFLIKQKEHNLTNVILSMLNTIRIK